METMIEVNHLRKQFGSYTAVEDISFTVKRGEVLGFLGPNGAGKSTTMKMITGFLTPTSGNAKVCGYDVSKYPIQVKTNIGYLPEGAPTYGEMTALSFLHFIAEIRGYEKSERTQRVNQAIEKANLESVLLKPVETLSKGFKRRVGLAQAIIHDPPVLIMDEPTDGLDPNQKHEVRLLIKKMAKDKAIVVSTHILEEVHAVCSRAIIIAQGKTLFDGTPMALAAQSKYHNAVSLSLSTEQPEAVEAQLSKIEGVASIERNKLANGDTQFFVFPKKDVMLIRNISHMARTHDWELDQLSVESGHLDDVFRQITTQTHNIAKDTLS